MKRFKGSPRQVYNEARVQQLVRRGWSAWARKCAAACHGHISRRAWTARFGSTPSPIAGTSQLTVTLIQPSLLRVKPFYSCGPPTLTCTCPEEGRAAVNQTCLQLRRSREVQLETASARRFGRASPTVLTSRERPLPQVLATSRRCGLSRCQPQAGEVRSGLIWLRKQDSVTDPFG